nr:MAG TPA: hypothetical protein [Microviridae sp.]
MGTVTCEKSRIGCKNPFRFFWQKNQNTHVTYIIKYIISTLSSKKERKN